RPIFFSLIIIVSAYIPLFALERVERRLFTPMAFTVCYALLGSMLLALTLIPVLATYLFRNAPRTCENPILGWLHARYERALRSSIAFPTRVLAGAATIVVAALVLTTLLGSVRVHYIRGAGAAQCAVLAGGWRVGALSTRHQFEYI